MKLKNKLLHYGLSLLTAGAALWSVTSSAHAADKKPNIVHIVADDLGWQDVGFNGAMDLKTPNLDALAKGGAKFTQFYVQPMCTPTRAALMTGRYPFRYGLQTIVIPGPAGYGLDTSEWLMPQCLKDAGYSTAIIGKWHLGHGDIKYCPKQRGFDYQYGAMIGELDYYTHSDAGVLDWFRNNKPVKEKGYTTQLIGSDAVKYINGQSAEKPFYLYLTFNAPHTPYQAPKEYVDRYQHVEDPTRRTYAGMITCLDDEIGRVVAALDQKGLRDNKLILFHSDNGGTKSAMFAGQMADLSKVKLPCDNGPYRDGKGSLYEGGCRVAACANWPGKIKPQTVDGIIHAVGAALKDAFQVRPVAHQAAGPEVGAVGKDGRQLVRQRRRTDRRAVGNGRGVGDDHQALHPLAHDLHEAVGQVFGQRQAELGDLDTEGLAGFYGSGNAERLAAPAHVKQHRHMMKTGHCLLEILQSLGAELDTEHSRTGHVPIWAGKAGRVPGSHRVTHGRKDDRHSVQASYGPPQQAICQDDHIGFGGGERDDVGVLALDIEAGEGVVNDDIRSQNPAALAQPALEGQLEFVRAGASGQVSNTRRPALRMSALRRRGSHERGRAAQHRAPVDHRFISSAGATWRPHAPTMSPYATSSLYHLVRAQQQRLQDRQAESLRGLEVDHKNPRKHAGTVAIRRKKAPTENSWGFMNGGTGGNRTPVREPSPDGSTCVAV